MISNTYVMKGLGYTYAYGYGHAFLHDVVKNRMSSVCFAFSVRLKQLSIWCEVACIFAMKKPRFSSHTVFHAIPFHSIPLAIC